jgi:MSHA pilin protein MshC
MNPNRGQAGFTMVELVTCIIILGILAAVAGPKLLDNSTLAGRTYSNEVAAAVREAQVLAVGSGCEVAITLNAGNYLAQQRSAAGNQCSIAGAWSVNVLRADGTTLAGTAPSNITISPATRIVFDPNGKVSSAAPPALTVGGYGMSIDARSGFVTLQ